MVDVKLKDEKSGKRPGAKVLDQLKLRLVEIGYDVFVAQDKTSKYAEMQIASDKEVHQAGFREALEVACRSLNVDYNFGRFYIKFSQSIPKSVEHLKKRLE